MPGQQSVQRSLRGTDSSINTSLEAFKFLSKTTKLTVSGKVLRTELPQSHCHQSISMKYQEQHLQCPTLWGEGDGHLLEAGRRALCNINFALQGALIQGGRLFIRELFRVNTVYHYANTFQYLRTSFWS